ncbi:hypothetical protein TRIATDRAFT_133503 [Trichoderma atroviride IMI 206040]|uniref:Uncharacterized protein n=1 Tax=Hypocrea atroviridis (strain ATCC 20476 / IMI 206040) TaxID=452589 RepID=G9NK13_HYPAI|nr:uncharacterized protein TRIATDRAFT_133503 [Trichoderma atroviride IMI 206040]EHK49233.1 hypothetical protein TRIATDRAFT_133503 [Trichoderma atroviride IMI 206040]
MASSSQQPEMSQIPPQTAPAPTIAAPPPAQLSLPAGYQPYPAPVAYAPYPVQQAFEPPRPPQNKIWEFIKLGLQSLSFVLAVVGVGLGFSTLNFVFFVDTVVIAAAPPCIIAILWSGAELITRAIRRFKAGIHPGAHVALSLIIFLVAVILTSLFGPWFQSSWNDSYDDDGQECSYHYSSTLDDYVYSCTDNSSDPEVIASRHQFRHENSVAYAAAIITYIVAVIHFVLFVGACIDTSKVNAAASRPIYVIAQPQGLQAMMQGWQPIQQAPAETEARDVAPTETEAEAETEAVTQSKGKGKEPMRGDVVEHDAPSGSQA